MKLLIISQYFYPEQFGVNDISSKLAALGHDVTVLTGLPNYPMGEIFDGYQWDEVAGQNEEFKGVKVLRCRLAPRKNGKRSLMINYISFAYYASLLAARLIREIKSKGRAPFDRVLVTQYSPVTMAIPAIIIKKKLRIPFILYCFDLWPESIVSAGLKNHGFLYNAIKAVSKYIYGQADKLIISSRNFEKYLRDKVAVTAPVYYIPMYAEDVFTDSSPAGSKTGSGSAVCSLMFAGNIGKMQSIETIISAAAELKRIYESEPAARCAFPIIFHMVGDGSALEESIALAKELGVSEPDSCCRFVFHGRHPVEEMPGFYNMADAMLITLKKDDFISYTLPNKVQTYMAAGKPILASIDGEAYSVIKEANCGSVCEAEDYISLAQNILEFAKWRAGLQNREAGLYFTNCGRNSRDYYEKHFSADNFIKNLLRVLE